MFILHDVQYESYVDNVVQYNNKNYNNKNYIKIIHDYDFGFEQTNYT